MMQLSFADISAPQYISRYIREVFCFLFGVRQGSPGFVQTRLTKQFLLLPGRERSSRENRPSGQVESRETGSTHSTFSLSCGVTLGASLLPEQHPLWKQWGKQPAEHDCLKELTLLRLYVRRQQLTKASKEIRPN